MASVKQIDKTIIDAGINLGKTHKIKLPDAVIASTALVYDYALITNNEKDFKTIDDLKIINPYNT